MIYQAVFSPVLAGIAVFVIGILLYSCQRDNISLSKETQVQSNVETPCATCVDYDLIKTAGNPNVEDEVAGTLQICQPSPSEITFTFTVLDNRENAWINQAGIAIDPTGENFTKLNPGFIDRTSPDADKARQLTITVDYTTLTKVVEGVERPLQPGDIICVATYSVKVPSGSQWPDNLENDGISFGGFTYTYAQAREIFFSSNKKTGKTDAKQAFLQGLALKLSMYGNSQTEPCPGTLDALNAIEAYFAAKAVKQTASTINTYAPNADLRAKAGLISDCLNTNHCDNTPLPAGS